MRSRAANDRSYHAAREAEHRHRRTVTLVAQIERELAELGRGPARHGPGAEGRIDVRDAAGELVASVGVWPGHSWWAEPVVEARLPSGEPWWPGVLVERAMLRTA